MFRKLLIANRGEIACRIIRTARKMGLSTVAVFSDADEDALHVEMADEAWRIGAAPAGDSYLSSERMIDAARRSGAEAVHPGYGFLAESADFAQQCIDAGLIFVGPSPKTIRAVGDKAAAKKLMHQIGVSVLPGYHGHAQDFATFTRAATQVGFPVMVKAAAGGGGRGMRIVRSKDELPLAIESARREALAAFGDGHLLLEKYVERPRHVEVQFVADKHGCVALFPERDCSLQRNHQKIVEETPAPGLPDAMRAGLRDATGNIVRACDYTGAGTAEFLVDGARFFFLEVNARLQVEHPVSEMVTGVDLVAWQLRVACGEALPQGADMIEARGHAIEARLCAEDPSKGFMPSSGVIAHLRLPAESPNLRLETGVKRGDRISTCYDSLLAKIVVWDDRRDAAVRRLQQALAAVELVGVETNLDFLRLLLRQARFQAGDIDLGFVQDVVGVDAAEPPTDERFLLAAAAANWRRQAAARAAYNDPCSPWSAADGWRLYGKETIRLAFSRESQRLECSIEPIDARSFHMKVAQGACVVSALWGEERLAIEIDGLRRDVCVIAQDSKCVVIVDGRNHLLEWIDPLAPPSRIVALDGAFLAPVPARVIRVLVKRGDHTGKGAPLILLEAMKMEIPIKAPGDGVVENVYCGEGQSVREGEELLAWRASDEAA
ncbi:biotin carboxylase N-terminal domain-containing protein [Methylocystis parvus]|uniref:ATP-grasp domain-containing protein n=1 Tax=Methylocystis parvus TaxID=134 RepID=A0A6B8M760_9HYPH|nr:biotin carboxylase N-terminal domain-containing protein [Methylocystis parvus]QGM97842.1 ATP-grasp domain-containing protein [Methylocystis parvus]WBK01849.1 ATP-grasp domain-containing protein [Methylocystis parvus OBBP]